MGHDTTGEWVAPGHELVRSTWMLGTLAIEIGADVPLTRALSPLGSLSFLVTILLVQPLSRPLSRPLRHALSA